MSQSIELTAKVREDQGKGASRRLRRLADQVPAIVYGGKKDPQAISIAHNHILQIEEYESFYTQVLTLDIEGKKQKVILKDIQRHPYKPKVAHLDFQRVDAKTKLHVSIPLHFIKEDVATKLGGHVEHFVSEVEVACLPANLPEFIEVDVSTIELGQTLHLSDIAAPKGVTFSALAQGEGHDLALAALKANKVVDDEAEEAATPEAAEDNAEPKEDKKD